MRFTHSTFLILLLLLPLVAFLVWPARSFGQKRELVFSRISTAARLLACKRAGRDRDQP